MILNKNEFPELIVPWLLNDKYEYINEEKYLSATTIIRPVREIILSKRVTNNEPIDLNSLVPSRIGSSLHESLQNLWLSGDYKKALALSGYPENFINKIRVNPTEPSEKDTCDIYVEQRTIKPLNGWLIGGQFDLVFNGQLNDYKTTSVITYTSGSRQSEYVLQGSIYRWLNSNIITEDTININYIFTDWNKFQTTTNPNYPKNRCVSAKYPLLSLPEIEFKLTNKLNELNKYWNQEEKDIPECPEESLWISESVYKYFSNPLKTTGRSTKNFSSLAEAKKYWLQEKQGKGVVIEQKGEPKKCKYCRAYSICSQRRKYFPDD